MLVCSKVKRTLLLAAVMAVAPGIVELGYRAGAAPLPAEKSPALAKELRGCKVLVAFPDPPVFLKKPTKDERAQAEEALRGAHRAALKEAKMDLLKVLAETRGFERDLVLVDCKGKEPKTALKKLPYTWEAIVFKNGKFQKGLRSAKGELPGAAVRKYWPAVPPAIRQRDKDLERFRKIPGIKVEFHPPERLSAGSAGWVKLIPKKGTTVLEVYLLTGVGFSYDKFHK
jgi:hypothetical protein